MEDILPAGNIAHAQVWSQYTGFLYYVLPGRYIYIHKYTCKGLLI